MLPTKSYLLTLPLCTGVSRMDWVSRGGDINLPPTKKLFTVLSSVAIFVYNRSAISVNRRDVLYQFLSSFSRLFVQEYETDYCLRNRTDNNTN